MIGDSTGRTVVWVYILIGVVLVLFAVFGKHLRKIFNKFTPLPEGELREKIDDIFSESGYTVKNIFVMDASRRTSKVNAYCSGLGRSKEIVLFDNLVDNYSIDEIAAVFMLKSIRRSFMRTVSIPQPMSTPAIAGTTLSDTVIVVPIVHPIPACSR